MSTKKKVVIITIVGCLIGVVIGCFVIFYKYSNEQSAIIPPIPEEEIIFMDDDAPASIKQNQDYYSQYTAEEYRASLKEQDANVISNAIFFYDFHDEDMLTELPTWVPNDLKMNYTLFNGEVDIDAGASAQMLTIEAFAKENNLDVADLNVRVDDRFIIILDFNSKTYKLFNLPEYNHAGANLTYYVVPYEE